ncbi:MAG: VOC family protein [Flavobacteriales bacterium]|nr:VOC family protein [Flavobacteriales bacterium]
MIKGLFETHLFVEDLERSMDFYQNVMGLKRCNLNDKRRVAAFWIGKPKQSMLGLWEMPKEKIDKRHFAFECDPEWVINESIPFLKSKNLEFRNFLNDGIERPMVFAWMPAVAIYFEDPDGHSLEFIGMLSGESRPEDGVVSYEDWLEKK